MQHEPSGWIGLDHMRVGPIVAAHREAAGWGMRRPGRSDRAGIDLHVRGLSKPAVTEYRKHRHGPAEVVRNEQMASPWVNADIGGAGAAGSYGVEPLQSAVGPTDHKGAGGALLLGADPVGLIR